MGRIISNTFACGETSKVFKGLVGGGQGVQGACRKHSVLITRELETASLLTTHSSWPLLATVNTLKPTITWGCLNGGGVMESRYFLFACFFFFCVCVLLW